ncbi:DUF6477 family protein [Acidimangrovimonas pyrenivorans]|uniref:DUF6477 family protein n=1 Tax=Acidimangrovimonas pyrenivorans TaxID=2030798 RepID=A0ABV7ADH2_9RHOB
MTDFRFLLRNLRRPRLLIRAARFGLPDYRRERDLRRLLRPGDRAAALPAPAAALADLLAQELRLEASRQAGDAGYSLARHVLLLIALMGEARLLAGPADP